MNPEEIERFVQRLSAAGYSFADIQGVLRRRVPQEGLVAWAQARQRHQQGLETLGGAPRITNTNETLLPISVGAGLTAPFVGETIGLSAARQVGDNPGVRAAAVPVLQQAKETTTNFVTDFKDVLDRLNAQRNPQQAVGFTRDTSVAAPEPVRPQPQRRFFQPRFDSPNPDMAARPQPRRME